MILSKKRITKASDQTAAMRRLVSACVISQTTEDRFSRIEAHILWLVSILLLEETNVLFDKEIELVYLQGGRLGRSLE